MTYAKKKTWPIFFLYDAEILQTFWIPYCVSSNEPLTFFCQTSSSMHNLHPKSRTYLAYTFVYSGIYIIDDVSCCSSTKSIHWMMRCIRFVDVLAWSPWNKSQWTSVQNERINWKLPINNITIPNWLSKTWKKTNNHIPNHQGEIKFFFLCYVINWVNWIKLILPLIGYSEDV